MRDLNNLLNNQIIQIFPDLADDIQFLDADLINLVQQVDAGDVRAVTLNCVDKLIGSSIAPNITFRIVIKGKQTLCKQQGGSSLAKLPPTKLGK